MVVLRVGHGRGEHLGDHLGGAQIGEAENGHRFDAVLAADQIEHATRLTGRHVHVFCNGFGFHVF
ncbi:hypothetical protein D3C87_2207410 [compost metagenome]